MAAILDPIELPLKPFPVSRAHGIVYRSTATATHLAGNTTALLRSQLAGEFGERPWEIHRAHPRATASPLNNLDTRAKMFPPSPLQTGERMGA